MQFQNHNFGLMVITLQFLCNLGLNKVIKKIIMKSLINNIFDILLDKYKHIISFSFIQNGKKEC